MKRIPLTFRMIMVFCAMTMMLAQLMGLHFHRHVVATGAGHGTSLHLRDAGVHLHESVSAHEAAGDRASHPDEDLEIDPLGAGVAKFVKAWAGPAFLLIVVLFLCVVMPVPRSGTGRITLPHPALFALRPPSNAPPPEPSLA